jgi:hypothetical protein
MSKALSSFQEAAYTGRIMAAEVLCSLHRLVDEATKSHA